VTGIDIRPVVKFKMRYGSNDYEISWLFQGFVDPATVRFDPLEIEQVSYYSLSELSQMIRFEENKISYWFKQLIQWYSGTPSDMTIMKIESEVRLIS
jgi:isopentenyldiphosphate isomerase